MQGERGLCAGGNVGDGDGLLRTVAVEADAHVGLLHLLGGGIELRLRRVVDGGVGGVVGVVGLPAEDAEDLAPALVLRVVLVDGDVGVAVAVLHGVLPFQIVALVLTATVGPLLAVLGADGDVYTDFSIEGATSFAAHYCSHLPVGGGAVYGHVVCALGEGVSAAAIHGEVLESVLRLHALHLVLLVAADGFLPSLNLVGTPSHAVHLRLFHLGRVGFHPAVLPDAVVRVAGLVPADVDATAGVVLVGVGRHAVGHLACGGHEAVALVFPLGYHHRLQLILAVHEVGGHGAAEGAGHVYLQLVFAVLLLVFHHVQQAGLADEDVGRCAHVDIAGRAHVGTGGTGADGIAVGSGSGFLGQRVLRGLHVDPSFYIKCRFSA